MTRICIYGAGSIGCYLGGRLQAAGAQVSFVGRPRMGAELQEYGLSLTDYRGGNWRLPPASIFYSTEPRQASAADFVLVTVKSAATYTAATELAGVLHRRTIVISFQNGLGNSDILQAGLPDNTVLAGMVPFNIVAKGQGAFHQGTEGELEVAAEPGLAPALPLFARAGLPLVQRKDILEVQWAKLLLNLNNPINALANLPLKTELSQRAYRQCLAMAQTEALGLLKQAGIRPAKLTPLPPGLIPRALDVPDFVFRKLAGSMLAIDPLARSSMSDDLDAKRPTEIDWINGEVTRLAKGLGQRAPVNTRLCELIREAENLPARTSWTGERLLEELRLVNY